jgi:hypothetical protein
VIRGAQVIKWSCEALLRAWKNQGFLPLSGASADEAPQKCKTVLTGLDVGHRSHLTDAVLLTGTQRRSPKLRRSGRPWKKGKGAASIFVAL